MPEVLIRLRVVDHSGPAMTDIYWQKAVETAFLPVLGDEIQLWGVENGPLAPVKRRWWRPDGRVVVEVASLIVDSRGTENPLNDDGRLRWVPWHSGKGDPVQLLRDAGWEMLSDG